jgi:hypothetical protein
MEVAWREARVEKRSGGEDGRFTEKAKTWYEKGSGSFRMVSVDWTFRDPCIVIQRRCRSLEGRILVIQFDG